MKIFFIISCIISCILRKKQHCIDNKILRNRHHPDLITKSSDNLIQNKYMIKKKLETISSNCNDSKLKDVRLKIKIFENNTKKGSKFEDIFIKKSDEGAKSTAITKKICMKEHDCNDYSFDFKIISNDKHFLSDHLKAIYQKIRQYMVNVFTDIQLAPYLQKLSHVNSIYALFIDKENYLRSYCSIFRPFDPKLVTILNIAISEFKTETLFVETAYDKFLSKIRYYIDHDAELSIFLINLRAENADIKRFLFYAEIINCAKYFDVIPELMTLVGIFSEKSIGDLILSIHLINLLLTNKVDAIKIKVFVLFLMKKAFSSSLKNRLDCFTVKTLHTDCKKNQHNLHFLIWEMNFGKRNHLRKKLRRDIILRYSKLDKIHFRAVILIFLYQNMIFLRYNDVNYNEAKKYFQLIDNIINENNCPDCDFQKFIILLQESNKE